MLVVLLMVLGTAAAGAIAKSNLAKKYPAPGRLVDVGGYKMHIHCTGQGSPTIILAVGGADFSLTWAYVQPEIAKTTRVCSYDRAGFGWSEPSPHPRTAHTMVQELHTLLVRAGIQGPYVLVGHSLGGLLVRGLGNLSLTAPVGTTYPYSNLNYNIAGLLVEVVSGQSYAEYVTQHIFTPLDMRHSYASHAPALKDGLAQGHAYLFGHAFGVEEPLLPARLPSGYLIASVEDLAHYAMALLWLIVVPRLLGVSIWTVVRIEIFYRELAYGVVASVVLGIGWSVIYTAINLGARKLKRLSIS